MIDLVLTNDWELFGDGSGDFYDVQMHPTIDLLSFLKENNSGITFFVEVGQQLIFKNSNIYEYEKIAKSWENILKQIISNPLNDIQLHIHPQWFFATFDGNYWTLPEDKWSIGQLDYEKAEELIANGKQYLEDLLSEYNYKCEVYRAGAYYIEPSENIIKILENQGFVADTSITKGRKVDGYYDYTDSEDSLLPWNVSDKTVKYKGENKLKEFPIYSKKLLYSEALNKFFPKFANTLHYGVIIPDDELEWIKERDRIKEIRYPRERRAYKKLEKKDFSWYLEKVIASKYVQLDYDYLPATAFITIIEKLCKKYKNQDIPIIASGHIKDAHTNYNLEKIINILQKDFKDRVNISSFKKIIEKY